MTDKIIHFKDFVKNIKELLNHCELRETKSIQDPDVWRSRRRGNDPDFFVLKKSAPCRLESRRLASRTSASLRLAP